MQSSRSFLALQIVAILTMIACSAAIADEKRDAQIAKATEALREKLVATRRDVHEHPELSNREERTSQLVAERLRALGFDEVKTGIAKHGVVVLVKGGKPGPVVAYRADMDALPITESNNVPYKSHSPGVMHACGHDAHTAIGLGVAEVLSKMRDQIPGSVKFLFQPAEEGAPAGEEGGAVFMIKEGALENPKPAAIFAMHVSPGLSVGTIGYRSGPAQCSIDTFTITIRGKVPFAGTPEAGVDSIVVAAQCVTALQTIKSRRLNSFQPIVLTIGSVHGGKGPFNTPEEVKLDGCLRTFSEDIRKQTLKLIRETLTGTTEAYGAKFDFENRSVTAVVVNNPDLVAGALPALRRTVGETNLVEMPKWMGGEDFSYYGQIVPGFLFRLGVGNKTKGITSDIHTPTFNIDEDSLSIGVKAMSMVLLDYLHQHAGAVPPR